MALYVDIFSMKIYIVVTDIVNVTLHIPAKVNTHGHNTLLHDGIHWKTVTSYDNTVFVNYMILFAQVFFFFCRTLIGLAMFE